METIELILGDITIANKTAIVHKIVNKIMCESIEQAEKLGELILSTPDVRGSMTAYVIPMAYEGDVILPVSKTIEVSWHVDDVIENAKEHGLKITDDEALEILYMIKHKHDATIGINWDVITDWTVYYMAEKGYPHTLDNLNDGADLRYRDDGGTD